MADAQQMVMWVVYDHPLDAPREYVAREWSITAAGAQPGEQTMASPDLAMLRRSLEHFGLVRLDRNLEDDPVILEVWL